MPFKMCIRDSRSNVAIDAPCSGNGSCGKCRVKLVEGELESMPTRHISDDEYKEGWRLSCASKVIADCTIFVPDIASAYQSRMKTADLSSPKEVAIFDECQENLKHSGIHFKNACLAQVLTLAAVSYTHLDVYKRQRQAFSGAAEHQDQGEGAAHPLSLIHISICASRTSPTRWSSSKICPPTP